MTRLEKIFEQNKAWAENERKLDPKVFERLAEKQTPKYLWIGCADSRVHPNEIMGSRLGEVFVHRNIANVFPAQDTNCLAVLEYAVNHLHIEDVIVCGHYGCGGVLASLENTPGGSIGKWLSNIKEVISANKSVLDEIQDPTLKTKKLVELNTLQQALNISQTEAIQNAWNTGRDLIIHSLVFDMATGLLKDLNHPLSYDARPN